MQNIVKSSTPITRKAVLNRISDVPGGISLELSSLIVGNTILEGTPLTKPVAGIRTVCKQAKLLTGSTTTVFRVENKTHHFKVGDILMQETGAEAYAITDVTIGAGTVDNVTYDTLTVGTALGSADAGTFVYQSSAAGAAAGSLLNVANVITKSYYVVPDPSITVIAVHDAFVRADVIEGAIGSLYLASLDVNEILY